MKIVFKVAEGWILPMEMRIREYETVIKWIRKAPRNQNDDKEKYVWIKGENDVRSHEKSGELECTDTCLYLLSVV